MVSGLCFELSHDADVRVSGMNLLTQCDNQLPHQTWRGVLQYSFADSTRCAGALKHSYSG
ncbi:hypothetical protein MCEMSHM24_02340 [Comamonadaceae bacterium]|jgi:hypothetical protein